MVMSWIWTIFIGISLVCGALSGRGSELGNAVMEGAQTGITVAFSMAGAICLWSGVGALMRESGISGILSRLLRPLIFRLFPTCRTDNSLAEDLSGNICANILGLGNAATPMGIAAARRLRRGSTATDELCRLVVLNTASIQLIPTNVAAVRSTLGSEDPFSILPAVWLSSICAAMLGLASAWLCGRFCKQ